MIVKVYFFRDEKSLKTETFKKATVMKSQSRADPDPKFTITPPTLPQKYSLNIAMGFEFMKLQ